MNLLCGAIVPGSHGALCELPDDHQGPCDAYPTSDAVADAIDYLLDAAFIKGTMDSTNVFDHYDAADFLTAAVALYCEAVTGEPSYG